MFALFENWYDIGCEPILGKITGIGGILKKKFKEFGDVISIMFRESYLDFFRFISFLNIYSLDSNFEIPLVVKLMSDMFKLGLFTGGLVDYFL